jgi:hypothetical protein
MSAIGVFEQDATSEVFLTSDCYPHLISEHTRLQNPETSLSGLSTSPVPQTITWSQVIILSPASILLRSEPPTSKSRSRLPSLKHAKKLPNLQETSTVPPRSRMCKSPMMVRHTIPAQIPSNVLLKAVPRLPSQHSIC